LLSFKQTRISIDLDEVISIINLGLFFGPPYIQKSGAYAVKGNCKMT